MRVFEFDVTVCACWHYLLRLTQLVPLLTIDLTLVLKTLDFERTKLFIGAENKQDQILPSKDGKIWSAHGVFDTMTQKLRETKI